MTDDHDNLDPDGDELTPDPDETPDETPDGDELDGDNLDPDDEDTPDDDGEQDDELVRSLRKEAGDYRRKLRDTETERDELRHELYRERVAALGVLADPDDLPFDAEALDDPDRLRELADELVSAKPHLRSRRIRQRAGQGEGSGADGFSLAAALSRGA